MPEQVFDSAKAEAFAGTMVGILNSAGLAAMISVGHRTGLFDTMAQLPPSSSVEIAVAAGLNERYVREWLGAMYTGGIVNMDPATRQFALPAEHAAFLTRAATPNNLALHCQYFAIMGRVEDDIVEAFKHGKGVPYSAYTRFHDVMAEDSGQSVVQPLEELLLPLAPDLIPALQRGARVADIGCSLGRAVLKMARLYPQSSFTGFDLSEDAIRGARIAAEAEGIRNADFVVRDCTNLAEDEAFDVVFTFDAVHDQGRPDLMLQGIRKALKPGGLYFMLDIKASSDMHKNSEHMLGSFLYSVSCMHCMSVSLAQGGMGLGAVWGIEKAQEMLADAGFSNVEVRELTHDPFNVAFLCRA